MNRKEPGDKKVEYPIGEDCPFCPFWKGRQENKSSKRKK